MRYSLLLLLAACGGDDPCAGVDSACIAVTVKSSVVDRIDNLEMDILYGVLHGTASTTPASGATIDLPIVAPVILTLDAEVPVGVVAAGKLSGSVLGTGTASTMLGPGDRASIEITLGTPGGCHIPGYYCGGNELAGDMNTVYLCNDGVPRARGRCEFGCQVQPPGMDDLCLGGPVACTEGRLYCGGHKLDGDPSTLHKCTGGVGTNKVVCADGCVVEQSANDRCR